jgi:hypothetical protein
VKLWNLLRQEPVRITKLKRGLMVWWERGNKLFKSWKIGPPVGRKLIEKYEK